MHTPTGDISSRRLFAARPRRFTTFLTHLIVIGIIFILPEMISTMGRPFAVPWQITVGIYSKSAIYIAVFYLNYFIILPSALKRHRPWMHLVLWNILVFVAALVLIWAVCEWLEPYWATLKPRAPRRMPPPPDRPAPRPSHLLHVTKLMVRDSVMLMLSVALSVALKLSGHWKNIEERSRRMTADRREQELNSLKNQLNPHFLFNTLNTIYALIAINPSTAQKAVHELSDMLRYVLYDNRPTVNLSQEFRFVSTYVDLMRLRLSPPDKVRFTCRCDPDMASTQIAPLLFIPLVENAFKHGNTGRPDDTITITLTAADGIVTCHTDNRIAPACPLDTAKEDADGNRSAAAGGIGLQNLRRRLDLIYGKNVTFTAGADDNRFVTDLVINTSNAKEKSS